MVSMNTVASKDGTPIAFDRTGDGPAVIFVNGATATRTAGAGIAELMPHFTVFSYDRRGRGDSGDTAPYAVQREIEDLDALLTEAGGEAFVFGHSSGAVLSLEAARVLSGKITKLAVYEPPFIIDDSRPPLPPDYVEHLDALIAADRRGDAAEYFLTVAVRIPAEFIAEMRKSPMWPQIEAVAHTISYDGAVMGDTMSGSPAPLARFASVTMPTLVMDGGASPQYMQHAAQALADVLPNVQYRTLEGQEHGAAPDVLVPVLTEFFAR
jgi:pimeloyl-ACP methyl ester carboxylesterase